jgi:hypothetical protein
MSPPPEARDTREASHGERHPAPSSLLAGMTIQHSGSEKHQITSPEERVSPGLANGLAQRPAVPLASDFEPVGGDAAAPQGPPRPAPAGGKAGQDTATGQGEMACTNT